MQMVEKRQNISLGQVEGLMMQMDVQSLKMLQCVYNSVCKNMHQKESIERITKVIKKKHDTVVFGGFSGCDCGLVVGRKVGNEIERKMCLNALNILEILQIF